MTLESALELIPTHIILRPKIDKWKEGDEIAEYGGDRWDINWLPCEKIVVEEIEGKPAATYRRAIPESVRKDMALDLKLSVEEYTTSEFQEWLLA